MQKFGVYFRYQAGKTFEINGWCAMLGTDGTTTTGGIGEYESASEAQAALEQWRAFGWEQMGYQFQLCFYPEGTPIDVVHSPNGGAACEDIVCPNRTCGHKNDATAKTCWWCESGLR